MPVVNVVSRLTRHLERCALLDLATGSADIPLALVERAEQTGLDLQIVATDLQPEILAVAQAAERPGRLRIEQADARSLPYEPDAFDIATLSLALHHFHPGEAVEVLSEMRRVAGYALVVSDLERSWPGYAGAWLFGNLTTRNRLTRHDAPLSVRRAYTPSEAVSLAHAAGWRDVRITSVFPFRYIMVGRP
ncbi:MAG: methyltransferase domain-containing protein [Thermomicrobiales bacterium]